MAVLAVLAVLPAFAAVAAPEPVRTSPWEHRMWRSASPSMLNYICNFSRQPASWCAEAMREQKVNPETAAELYGPQLTADDARWLRLVASIDLQNLSDEDGLFIKKRAEELRDPQAMEALGYLYAQGVVLDKDYAKAYLWYGRAYLAGEHQVKPNMDLLWKLINQKDRKEAEELARVFQEESNLSPAEPREVAVDTFAKSSDGALLEP